MLLRISGSATISQGEPGAIVILPFQGNSLQKSFVTNICSSCPAIVQSGGLIKCDGRNMLIILIKITKSRYLPLVCLPTGRNAFSKHQLEKASTAQMVTENILINLLSYAGNSNSLIF
jgi:hypothetical protein